MSTSPAVNSPSAGRLRRSEERDEPERAVQGRLDVLLDERREHDDPPEAEDHARNRGQHLDQRTDHRADPAGRIRPGRGRLRSRVAPRAPAPWPTSRPCRRATRLRRRCRSGGFQACARRNRARSATIAGLAPLITWRTIGEDHHDATQRRRTRTGRAARRSPTRSRRLAATVSEAHRRQPATAHRRARLEEDGAPAPATVHRMITSCSQVGLLVAARQRRCSRRPQLTALGRVLLRCYRSTPGGPTSGASTEQEKALASRWPSRRSPRRPRFRGCTSGRHAHRGRLDARRAAR